MLSFKPPLYELSQEEKYHHANMHWLSCVIKHIKAHITFKKVHYLAEVYLSYNGFKCSSFCESKNPLH